MYYYSSNLHRNYENKNNNLVSDAKKHVNDVIKH